MTNQPRRPRALLEILIMAVVAAGALAVGPAHAEPSAADPGAAPVWFTPDQPPLSWNSWYVFKGTVTEQAIRETADALVDSGLRDAGFRYLNLDHMWQAKTRDADGRLQSDPVRFPSGIASLADYLHDRGIGLGIYATCHHTAYPGSFGYEALDAQTFADWGVDYVKYDFCDEPAQDLGPDLDKITITSAAGPVASVEAESATLLGAARAVTCPTCSSGQRVSGVGTEDGALQVAVTVPVAGDYQLRLDYLGNNDKNVRRADDPYLVPDRRLRVQTAEGASWVSFDPLGDVETVGTQTTTVHLTAGDNVITVDNPETPEANTRRAYERMRDALDATDRPMWLEVCEWGSTSPWEWAPQLATDTVKIVYRSTQDIGDSFTSVQSVVDQQVGVEQAKGPGGWNFPEMVRIGGGVPFPRDEPGGMGATAYRAQLALWSVLNAPLQLATDLRSLAADDLALLTDREILAIDQDWSATAGRKVADDGDTEVWAKPMTDGSVAVALWNRGERGQEITTTPGTIGLSPAGGYRVRDLWDQRDTLAHDQISAHVPGHGAALLRIWPENQLDRTTPSRLSLDLASPTYVVPGEPTQVRVSVRNDGRTVAGGGQLGVALPEGWRAAPDSVMIPRLTPGAQASGTITVTAPDGVVGRTEFTATLGASRWLSSFDVAPAAPAGPVFLSDLTPTHDHNGNGLVTKRDGPQAGVKVLRIGGLAYDKGLGTYAWSDVRYHLGGRCATFTAEIGIDDSARGNGSATFEVWADGALLYRSPVITGGQPALPISVDVAGVHQLRLVTTNGGDAKYQWIAIRRFTASPGYDDYVDRTDWGSAHVAC